MVRTQIKVARDEIRNLRKSMDGLKRVNKKDRDNILKLLSQKSTRAYEKGDEMSAGKFPVGSVDESSVRVPTSITNSDNSPNCIQSMEPIGFMKSVFVDKNGTPRQPVVAESRGSLKVSKNVFNNPSHSLHGLEKYSHVWILFVFHKNSNSSSCASSDSSSSVFTKAKVHPPRLGGASVGVFACRSPHRPNPVGLTLAKIENIVEDVIEVSSIDLIDGTPVLDLKPYIPDYDQPRNKRRKIDEAVQDASEGIHFRERGVKTDSEEVLESDCLATNGETLQTQTNRNSLITLDSEKVATADWLRNANMEESKFEVIFTSIALRGLEKVFHRLQSREVIGDHDPEPEVSEDGSEMECPVSVEIKPTSVSELKSLIENILREDPRSVYRKTKCREMLYFSRVCGIRATSWFDDDNKTVTVLKIE